MVLRRTFLHCALSLSMTLACKASRQTDSDGLSTAGANATSQNIESLSRKSWAKIKNLQSKEKRFVYSPLSLYTGLHLHNILANEPIDNSLDALHKAFRATPGLTAANAIYTEASGNLLRTMQAQLSQIDSQGGINPTEYSTNALNQWILNQTQGKIKDLLTNPPPRPFGINAIYFKSQWINKFNPSSTSSMTFTTAKKQEVQAQMMQGDLKGFFSRPSETFPARVLGLPMHNDFVMTFILPVDGNEAEVEGKLSSGYSVYKNLLAEDPTPTSVYLPRFKIEAKSPIEVTEALGLSKGTSQIFHSAGMEIDEEGATGEAVTIVRTRGAGGPPTFYGNRPFYFSVFHRPTQTEIFFGYLGDPT